MKEFDNLGARQEPIEYNIVAKDWRGDNVYNNQQVYIDESDNIILKSNSEVIEYIKENYTLDEIVCELITMDIEMPFGLKPFQL